PFAIALGDPTTGAHRLNLDGGVNSFGTTIGPIAVALALFGHASVSETDIENASISSMNWLYIAVGALFLLSALLFATSKKLPNVKEEDSFEHAPKAMWLLIIITIVMIVIFGIIFASYRGLAVNEKLSPEVSVRNMWLLVAGLAFMVVSFFTANAS